MAISVADPISRAFERTKTILFSPFDLGKWFTLGFCAFLANLGRGNGGNFNCNFPTGGGSGGGSGGAPPGGSTPGWPQPGGPGGPGATPSPWGPTGTGTGGGYSSSGGTYTSPSSSGGGYGSGSDPFEALTQWFQSLSWSTIVLFSGIVVLAIVGLGLLIMWLGSRGEFMFLDGVVHNRGAVVEPWKKYRRLGNSLFGFRVTVILVYLGGLLLAGGLCVAIAWPDIQAQRFEALAITAVVVGVSILFVMVLVMVFINLWLQDFVVPIMYLGDLNTTAAYRLFFGEIVSGHVGSIVLFYLMKFVLSIAIGIVAMIATCLTCCLPLIPYIGTVILLPLFVFSRCYPLYFLQQFGSQWQVFLENRCAGCGYDLRGSVGQASCPECGREIPIQQVTPSSDAILPDPSAEIP